MKYIIILLTLLCNLSYAQVIDTTPDHSTISQDDQKKVDDVINHSNEYAWSATNYTLEALTATSLLIDRDQTQQIASHPDLIETNRILGQHPSNTKINTYFALMELGQLGIADVLPNPYRNIFLGTVTTVEVLTIRKNKVEFRLNVKI
jgi:hypothetical protein